MTNTNRVFHPYSLEISQVTGKVTSYRWAIRKNGKLAQRSDRHLASEAKARESGEAQIEKLLAGFGDR